MIRTDSLRSAEDDGRAAASIIVEWENARTVGASRAEAVVDELLSQIRGVSSPQAIELVFVCTSGTCEEADIQAILAARKKSLPNRVKIVAVETGDYYQQKNLGAAAADGRLLLFIDSDVVPQPGWLRGMLEAADDPRVDVVGGVTIVSCSGFYERAMALIWIFPLRPEQASLVPVAYFHANNFAISATLFAGHRFPDTGQHRGQCGLLADELRSAGRRIWLSQRARVEHPPPEGVRQFFLRAWRSGRDEAMRQRIKGKSWIAGGTKVVAADLLYAFRRVRSDHGLVGFGPVRALAAAALALAYYGTRYLGLLSSGLSPHGGRASKAA